MPRILLSLAVVLALPSDAAVGPERTLTVPAQMATLLPVAAFDGNVYTVAWSQVEASAAVNETVAYARLSESGTVLTPRRLAYQTSLGFYGRRPAVAAANGHTLLVWMEGSHTLETPQSVRAQWLGPDGQAVGLPVTIKVEKGIAAVDAIAFGSRFVVAVAGEASVDLYEMQGYTSHAERRVTVSATASTKVKLAASGNGKLLVAWDETYGYACSIPEACTVGATTTRVVDDQLSPLGPDLRVADPAIIASAVADDDGFVVATDSYYHFPAQHRLTSDGLRAFEQMVDLYRFQVSLARLGDETFMAWRRGPWHDGQLFFAPIDSTLHLGRGLRDGQGYTMSPTGASKDAPFLAAGRRNLLAVYRTEVARKTAFEDVPSVLAFRIIDPATPEALPPAPPPPRVETITPHPRHTTVRLVWPAAPGARFYRLDITAADGYRQDIVVAAPGTGVLVTLPAFVVFDVRLAVEDVNGISPRSLPLLMRTTVAPAQPPSKRRGGSGR